MEKSFDKKNTIQASIIAFGWTLWHYFIFNIRYWNFLSTDYYQWIAYVQLFSLVMSISTYIFSVFLLYSLGYRPEIYQNRKKHARYIFEILIFCLLNNFVLWIFSFPSAIFYFFLIINFLTIYKTSYCKLARWSQFRRINQRLSLNQIEISRNIIKKNVLIAIGSGMVFFSVILLKIINKTYINSIPALILLILGNGIILLSIYYYQFYPKSFIFNIFNGLVIITVNAFALLRMYVLIVYNNHFTEYSFIQIACISLMWVLFTFFIILFGGRTNHSDIIEHHLSNYTNKNKNPYSDASYQKEAKTENPAEKKISTSVQNEIECSRCSYVFDLPHSMSHIFTERENVFCPSCGKEIYWFDMQEIDENFLLSQHMMMLNEIRKDNENKINNKVIIKDDN